VNIRNYDEQQRKCKVCQFGMNKEYYLNYHDPAECFKQKIHRDLRLAESKKILDMVELKLGMILDYQI
jgi:hypothetical protein